jgi:hypothetical protein
MLTGLISVVPPEAAFYIRPRREDNGCREKVKTGCVYPVSSNKNGKISSARGSYEHAGVAVGHDGPCERHRKHGVRARCNTASARYGTSGSGTGRDTSRTGNGPARAGHRHRHGTDGARPVNLSPCKTTQCYISHCYREQQHQRCPDLQSGLPFSRQSHIPYNRTYRKNIYCIGYF